MTTMPSARVQWWSAMLAAALVTGCGDDETGPDRATPCGAGEELVEGECVVPAESCGEDETFSLRDATCVPLGWRDCPTGFEPDERGVACVPLVALECSTGTRPKIGEASCVPVGAGPCPDGFVEGAWGCEDVIAAAPCAGATRDAIGESACVPVGDCLAAFPPAGATLFVDDDYSAGELDATHFATIGDALAASTPGDVVAVESGTYAEALVISTSVEIVGRCPGETVLSGDETAVGIDVGAADVTLTGFTVAGHDRGLLVHDGGLATLTEVVLDDNLSTGLIVTQGSSAVLERSVVRGTRAVNDTLGYGVSATLGGEVTLTDTAIVGNTRYGLRAIDAGSALTLNRCVVRATAPDSTGEYGLGLLLQKSARAEIAESVFADNTETALIALDGGTSLSVSSSVIRDTALSSLGFARAVDVDGAFARLEDVTLSRHQEVSVLTLGPATVVELERVTIEDTAPDASGVHGSGVHATDGSHVKLTDVAIVRSGDQALYASDVGTLVEATGTLLAESGEGAGTYGRGLSAYDGARLVFADSAIRANREVGALVSGPSTALEADTVVIDGTVPDPSGNYGRGATALGGASATFSASLIADNHDLGVFAIDPGTAASLTETWITRTAPRTSDGTFGRGAGAQAGASLTVERSAITDNAEVGVFGAGAGTTLSITDALVARSIARTDGRAGLGVVLQTGATGVLDRTVVADHHVVALLVTGEGTTASATQCRLARTAPGTGAEAGFAHGAVAAAGARLDLALCDIASHAGIGVAFAGASGFVDACIVHDNAVGIHSQDGSTIQESTSAPNPAPLEVAVSTDSRFVDNQTRVGAEVLPMPESVLEASSGP